VAAATHRGAVREQNEDTVAVGRTFVRAPLPALHRAGLAPVAGRVLLIGDGMGGRPAGEVASRHVVATLIDALDGKTADEATIRRAVRTSSEALFAAMDASPSCVGMGTTVAGLAFRADAAVAFNVGDSRVYRLAGGRLRRVSVDDRDPVFGSITAVLGGALAPGDVVPHIATVPLAADDTWLLCSDGVTDLVDDPGIRAALALPPEQAVQRLFDAAMAGGGYDNISMIVARVDHAADRGSRSAGATASARTSRRSAARARRAHRAGRR
jgi:serine/threonine protein phosphatase PrpC